MPYIKEPDFAEICVLLETAGEIQEIYNDVSTTTLKTIIDKTQSILKRYKHE